MLVQVNELVFLVDFYIVNIDDNASPYPAPLSLRRMFLKIVRIRISVNEGTMMMEFDSEQIWFNIYKVIRCLSDAHSVYAINFIDFLA